MSRTVLALAMMAGTAVASTAAFAQARWPAGDEIGMANHLGSTTWARCAPLLANPKAKSYEVSHIRSNSMPQSPFGTPLVDKYKPTVGIPGTLHAFNGEETVSGEPGAQGTQMDALGHFAVLPEPWDGKSPFPSDRAKYYGGHTQQQVKPSPDAPLEKLGIEKVPPIVTTAVLLDAKAHQPTTDPRIDAAGQILTPGFISGHSHAAAGTLTRGWIEENGVVDRSGPSRSFFRAMDLIDSLSDDDLDDLTALNVAEMVRGGCTTQVEMSLSLKQVQSYVRVATRYGVRGFGGGMVPGMTRLGPIWNRPPGRIDILEGADADTLAEIAANLKYARSVQGSADGLINMMMAPSVTPVFTAASFKAIQDAVVELGTATHVHIQANNNPRHQALIHEYWKTRELEMLQKTGLLNQRVFGAHCYLEDPEKDLAVMANPNFTFIHCPSAAGAGQRSSTQVYPEALAAGVNTSIGFDTHSNDYVENMKLAVIQGRGRAMLLAKTSPVKMKEPTIWDALKSGTLAGAKGLGRKDLGRIEAGAKADLCTIDVSGLLIGTGVAPREPWNNLLYANGLSVRNVIIDGEWKVRDGSLTFDDEARVKARGGEAAKKIWDRLEKDGFFVKMPR